MFDIGGMMKTNSLLERALDVESLRRKVISNNVANVDTPHFKRSEVNFESELRRTIETNAAREKNSYPGMTTDERHIPFNIFRDETTIGPRVNLDYTTTLRNDGNNVDIEKEMVDASKNLMRYNAMVNSLGQNFKIMKLVMRSNV